MSDMNLTIQKTSITGTRWKCVVCYEYDLCGKCNKTVDHDHRMLAIEHPDLRYLYEKVRLFLVILIWLYCICVFEIDAQLFLE